MSGDERNRNQPSGLAAARAARTAPAPASSEMEILLRRVERERQARKQAEQLLERKSLELFETNQRLQAQAARLEITVQERTRALEEAAARMQDALRTKGEFLAVVSHEIRTPMNGVLGMAQLLQMTELTEEQKRYVETIQTSGETLLTIINDILDLSKLDAGSVHLDTRPVELRAVVKEVADLLGGAGAEEEPVPGRRDRRRCSRLDQGGRYPAQAGLHQSGGQRHQVHSCRRRAHRDAHAAAGPGAGMPGPGHGHRHPSRQGGPAVREVLAGRQLDHPPLRRHRAGPGDLQAPGRGHGRADPRREQAARRLDLHVRHPAHGCGSPWPGGPEGARGSSR